LHYHTCISICICNIVYHHYQSYTLTILTEITHWTTYGIIVSLSWPLAMIRFLMSASVFPFFSCGSHLLIYSRRGCAGTQCMRKRRRQKKQIYIVSFSCVALVSVCFGNKDGSIRAFSNP
jgi:hypothetical protein